MCSIFRCMCSTFNSYIFNEFPLWLRRWKLTVPWQDRGILPVSYLVETCPLGADPWHDPVFKLQMSRFAPLSLEHIAFPWSGPHKPLEPLIGGQSQNQNIYSVNLQISSKSGYLFKNFRVVEPLEEGTVQVTLNFWKEISRTHYSPTRADLNGFINMTSDNYRLSDLKVLSRPGQSGQVIWRH